MKRTLIFLLVCTLLIFGCTDDDFSKEIPKCIQENINDIANGEVWNPPAKIYSYQYNEQKVYYFPPRCCDIQSTLYDENCTFICAPDGGITGNGDGQCPAFFAERTDEKLIWEDNRK